MNKQNQNVQTSVYIIIHNLKLKPLKLHVEEVHVYEAVQSEENPVETKAIKTH